MGPPRWGTQSAALVTTGLILSRGPSSKRQTLVAQEVPSKGLQRRVRNEPARGIFCKIVVGQMPCSKLLEDDDTLAFMDIYPANDGHCLVIAKEHYPTLFDISDETRLWCKWRRPINYIGVLSWLRSSMGKLKAVAELFEGRHFDREVIILCVRWYLRFKLSLRDLVEMMAERGLSMAHTTIMRWVQRYAPEFEKRWRRFARAVGQSWRVDETYVKIRGEWRYLYRAVDRAGRTVDFRLSPRRDVAAAKAFFRKAIKSQQRCPRTITLDGYAASHRAVRELEADGSLPANTKLRSSKYLNNLIEQDHRGVKQRIAVMLGFKEFRNAAITIAGIELLHRIRKGQFRLGRLGLQGQAAPEVWNAVLGA